MKRIKLITIVMAAILIAVPRFDSVYARGGGGHGGGGWGGGGRGGGRGDHNNDRRNEHNNNFYRGGDWGWGAADGAIVGLEASAVIDEASQPSTIIVDQQSASGSPAYGTQVTVLPPGSVSRNVNGTVAYECGSVWYRPYFGSSGVYYEVVSPPPADNQ